MIIIKKVAINTLALYLAAYLFPSFTLDSPATAIVAAFLLSILSITLRPVLLLVSLPLSLISFGIFILVIDAWMLQLVDLIMGKLYVPGFQTAFVTVLLIMILNLVSRKLLASF